MVAERRNDLGGKVLASVLAVIIATLLLTVFNMANGNADKADKKADLALTRVAGAEEVNAVQKVQIIDLKEDLTELKTGQHEIKNLLLNNYRNTT